MYEIDMDLLENPYSIFIKKGLLDHIGDEIKKIYSNEKIAIITDKNIEKLYEKNIVDSLKKKDFDVKLIVVNPGEQSKSMDTLKQVYKELLDFKITRGDLIITFGGGVVGDLGGFAASTLLRGIPFIQIPTSLLAQIDSSIGGKVAINLDQGKNLVGSFYHPKRVFIDPDLLRTLHPRFFQDGMAEVIKYGCIKDKELFEQLMKYTTKEELMDDIEQIIHKCCCIKKTVVEKDERDLGERMVLNFGHTLGHAIEKYYHYERYTHGEAVAIGMYHITQKSEAMGITKKGTSNLIKELLIQYGLSYSLPEMNKSENIKAIGLDKKNKGNSMHIVLLKEIGKSFMKEIQRKEIEQYL